MLSILLALAPPALAGAGLNFTPGVEGQQGFGAPVVSPSGQYVAITAWNRVGLSVLDLRSGRLERVSGARGAGFAPVWDGDALVFKAVADNEQEAWRWQAGRSERLDAGPRIGQPTVVEPGSLVWTRGDSLSELDGASLTSLPGVGDVDLLTASPDGDWLAWNDGSGHLQVRDLATGETTQVSVGDGFRPAWSPDGLLVAVNGFDGQIRVVDPARNVVVASVSGAHPIWIPGTRSLVFDVTETSADEGQASGRSAYEIVAASLWSLNADTGAVELRLADDRVHPRFASALPNGDLLFVDTVDGALWRLGDEGISEVLAPSAPEGAPPPPSYDRSAVDMPYMHQLYDTPDNFDGGWSCGPTASLQTIAKFGNFPNADIGVSWPSPHTSHWGWYVPNNYNYNGYQYDAWGVAKSSDCQGAHGFVCREYGGAVWSYMTTFMSQHGVASWSAGTDFNTLVGEVNAGYPMVASTSVLGYGHIIAVRGFLTSGGSPIHSIVVNEPYGNAGSGSWGNFDGEAIVYDWPGYDNGYLEIGISQLFAARGTYPAVDPPAEEPPAEEPAPAPEPEPVVEAPEPEPAPYDRYDLPHGSKAPGNATGMEGLGGCDASASVPGAVFVVAGVLLAGRRRG